MYTINMFLLFAFLPCVAFLMANSVQYIEIIICRATDPTSFSDSMAIRKRTLGISKNGLVDDGSCAGMDYSVAM